MARKAKRTYGVKRGSRKVGKRIDWFWEAYWKENGRDVSRQSSENAYGDGIERTRSGKRDYCRGVAAESEAEYLDGSGSPRYQLRHLRLRLLAGDNHPSLSLWMG